MPSASPTFAARAALLLPPPRRLEPGPHLAALPTRWPCDLELSDAERAGPVENALARLAKALFPRAVELLPGSGKDALRARRDHGLPGESYRLRVDGEGVLLVFAEPRGLAHGLRTLAQWLELGEANEQGLAGVVIEDGPSFADRGLLLDVSRNRVPTLRHLHALIELLADLKLNQLQLYTEHTFAYAGHGAVWRDASPLTGAEIRELDAACAARGIELVPCQNSFGHLHRWLVHEPYRALAECPEGIDHPFSLLPEPFSLCAVDPGSLALLRDLYDQLLPHFTSRSFNTGLDETFDLGRCRSAAACQARGKAAVYLEWLAQVHTLCAERGRRMMFWGDVLLEHPEAIAAIPEDAIVLEWGYEADHPFEADAARFAAAGRDFYVCPGTSGWNSFGGRTRNARANLAAAARAGSRQGARGFLITDWGDHGHLQPAPIGWPGYVLGAAFAWNADSADRDLPWAAWLDRQVFGRPGAGVGELLLRLGEAGDWTGASSRNGSALFFALMFAHKKATDRRGEGMSRSSLAATRQALAELGEGLAPACRQLGDGAVGAELAWVLGLLELAAELADARLGLGEDLPLAGWPGRKTWLRRLEERAEELRPLWRGRSRPGGLEASLARLLAVRDLL